MRTTPDRREQTRHITLRFRADRLWQHVSPINQNNQYDLHYLAKL